jgi:hypothetical protein
MNKLSTDYLPLEKGLTLTYVFVDHAHAQPDVTRVVWKVEELDGGLAKASIRVGSRPPVFSELRKDEAGVRVDGVLDLKLPLVEGAEWRGGAVVRRVLSFDAVARALDRDYEGCLEVGLTNEDTDSGSRFYHPRVGLVREDWSGESRDTSLILISAA